jgi:probable HAF family extracellular repeat protein
VNTRIRTCTVALSLIAATAIPLPLSAQDNRESSNSQPRFKLIDLGTLGGPQSWTYGESTRSLSNDGIVGGLGDTAVLDPNPIQNPYVIFNDGYLHHGFRWENGVKTDLGALPGPNSSSVFWIDDNGIAVGGSGNGSIDPLTGWTAEHAVLWKDGHILDLGTLGGHESQADSINRSGQVVGFAANAAPDSLPSPLGLPGYGTQQRAFIWRDGMMTDLGTLGGPDAVALLLNERGQVAGLSYVNSTVNTTTGLPTTDSFIWENGVMTDLGSLGGNYTSFNWLSQRGEIVGQSNLAGDRTNRPFLWSRGALKDLGTLGGDFGSALWVNEAGVVVGWATNQNNQAQLAFLWKNGVMISLGTLGTDPCSIAWANNEQGEIIGSSSAECNFAGTMSDEHAFLWKDGNMIDLNTLVPPGSDLTLVEPHYINERGEISGNGVLPNGDLHGFLLIPDEDDANADTVSDRDTTGPTVSASPHTSASPDLNRNLTMTVKGRFGKPYTIAQPKPTN